MVSSRKTKIDLAWNRIEYHFRPIQSGLVNAEDSVKLIEEQLRPFFTNLWGQGHTQFEIPADYRYFLSFSSAGWRCDEGLGFAFYSLSGVINNTKFAYRLPDEEDDEMPPSEQSIWLLIGHWSDKHDVFICCDLLSPKFGAVADCHDGDPWNAPEVCTPFQDFLAYLSCLTF